MCTRGLVSLWLLYLCVIILSTVQVEAHGFEVLRGPCFPGSFRYPNPCESCVCGFLGFQYYCVKLCFDDPTSPTTRATPTSSTTTRTSRSLGVSIQQRIPAPPANQDPTDPSTTAVSLTTPATTTSTATASSTTIAGIIVQTPGENDEDLSIGIPPSMDQ